MPTLFSYKNDDDVDERANPVTHGRGQEEFNDEARGILDDEGLNSTSAELNQLEQGGIGAPAIENPSRSEKAQDQLNNGESQGAGDSFRFNPSPAQAAKKSIVQVGKAFIKKRGSVIAITAIVGGLITILLTSFGMATLGVNIFENATWGNDSTSTVMERLARNQLKRMFLGDDAALCGSSMTIKCKSSKMSYKTLDRLSGKGVVAMDGNTPIDTKQTGFPEKNPSSYSVDMGDGKAPRIIASTDMPDFLSAAENKKIAYKVVGRGGAINMRFRAWTGKYITKRLFRVFNLSRKGGIGKNSSDVDPETGKPKKVNAEDRIKETKESIPKSDSASGGAKNIGSKTTEKINKLSSGAGKGGAVFNLAVLGCIGVKMPAIIAASAAAIQLAQLLPLAQDVGLSVGSMEKAAGLGSGFTQEAAQALGDFLTTKVENENGELKSPLDSAVLLSALGVNTNKPAIPEKLAPGYWYVKNPITRIANNIDSSTEEACNVTLSPYAAYTAMAIQAAAALSGVATIPALLNLAGGYALDALKDAIIQSQPFKELVQWAATELLTNDSITEAIEKGGEAGGHAFGLSLIGFFGAGGLSRHMPVLKQSQITAFNNIQKENEQFQRDLEIAALSPFDTSSKYTFLGSIVYNMSIAMVKSGNYNDSFSSILSNIFSLPGIALSSFTSSANAATNYDNADYCSYADEWGLDTGEDTPAITMSGLPCPGITQEQASMSFEESVDILGQEGEGWIDENIEVDGDIEDLVTLGYIKEDTPMTDYIEDCGNPSSGDYLYNAASCTVDEGASFVEPSVDISQVSEEDQQATATVDTELKDSRAIEAIAVFLLNYQVMQSINGEDEGEPEEDNSTSSSSTDSGITGEVDPNGWASPVQSGNAVTSPYGYRDGPFNGYEFHDGVDLSGSNGPIFAVRDGTVTAVGVAPGGGWGNWISIDHGEVAGVGHIYSFYAHLASVNVSVGDTVKAGQQIGVMGTTGNSTGVHLHFGIYKIQPGDSDKNGSTTYNPAEVLPSLIGGG